MAQSRGFSPIPASALVIVAAALGGALWYQPPLRSYRPQSDTTWNVVLEEPETLAARLWQDPIRVVEERLTTIAPMRSFGVDEERSGATLFLPVVVPGGPEAESIEQRLRTRYAVVSALGADGFVPRSRDSIGFLSLEEQPQRSPESGKEGTEQTEGPADGSGDRRGEEGSSDGVQSVANAARTTYAPFEWYDREVSGVDEIGAAPIGQVVVCWVDDTTVRGSLLGGVLRLSKAGFVRRPPDHVRILGPDSSNGLIDVLKEVDVSTKEAAEESAPFFQDWELLNFRATAPEALVLDGVLADRDGKTEHTAWNRDDAIAVQLEKEGLIYRRLLATDDELMLAMARELQLRDLDLASEDLRILVVSELDTFYGRSLATALSAILENATDGAVARALERSGHDDPALRRVRGFLAANPGFQTGSVQRVSYLRGLDGAQRAPKTADSKDSERAGPGAGQAGRAEWRQAVGTGQLDYLRREAQGLQRESDDIDAVAVVGTDLYDVQLALQALRPVFPRALFFTTDVDARLLHSSQYDWARNVLVASAYGLELRSTLQGECPAFRDSYQTAAYAATRLALGNADFEKAFGARSKAGWGPSPRTPAPNVSPVRVSTTHAPGPRVFEIARSGAWDLATRAGPAQSGRGADSSVHPAPPSAWGAGAWRYPLVLVFGLTLLVLNSTVLGQLRSAWQLAVESNGARCLKPLFVVALGSIGFLLAGWIVVSIKGLGLTGDEPFAVAQGVSAWPTQAVRSVIVVFTLNVLAFGVLRLVRNTKEIEADFGLTRTWRAPRWRRSLGWSAGFVSATTPVSVDAESVWRDYVGNASALRALPRVAGAVFVYFTIYGLVILMHGIPDAPIRGSRILDSWMQVAASLCFGVLLVFVHDLTRECSNMVYRLTQAPTKWPEGCPALERLGMAADDAAGVLDVELVASRTKAIGPIVLAPSIVLLLVILSRNHYFDHWQWPLSLLLALCVAGLLCLFSAVRMRTHAERARRISLARLEGRLVSALGAGPRERADQLREVIEQVKSLRKGAFGPWFQNPAIQALLVPFGGVGAVAAIDWFVQSGL